jgi:hypothetical protein
MIPAEDQCTGDFGTHPLAEQTWRIGAMPPRDADATWLNKTYPSRKSKNET